MSPARLLMRFAGISFGILVVISIAVPDLVFGAGPYALITNTGDHTVSRIDLSSWVVDKTVGVGNSPRGAVFGPTGGLAYVFNSGGAGTVNRIRKAGGVVDQTVNVPGQPEGAVFSPDGTTLYVSQASQDKIAVIDVATGVVTDTINNVGDQPMGLDISPDGAYLYAALWADRDVAKINITTKTVTGTVNTGFGPRVVTVSPDGSYLYVANSLGSTVYRIRTDTFTHDQTVNVGNEPVGVSFAPGGATLYVTNSVDDTVSQISVATGTVTKTIPVHQRPWGLMVHPCGKYVLVACRDDDVVDVIDTTSGTVVRSISVGDEPFSLGNFIEPFATCPDPQDFPPGGGPNQLGGGGPNDPPPLNPGGGSTDPGNNGFTQNRMIPLAGTGGGTATTDLSPKVEEVPGLVYQLIDPSGSSTDYWLPLGGEGTLPGGVEWTTSLRYNRDVRVVDISFVWPEPVVLGLTDGRYTQKYWFQDSLGQRSNPRWEYLDVGGAVTDKTGRLKINDELPDLTFNLMLSVFAPASGLVAKVSSGTATVTANGSAYSTAAIADGLVSITIPNNQASTLTLASDQFSPRTLSFSFNEGLLNINDDDHRSCAVEYYAEPDGTGYCLEYYWDLLMICNPGDPGGPVMGRLYGE